MEINNQTGEATYQRACPNIALSVHNIHTCLSVRRQEFELVTINLISGNLVRELVLEILLVFFPGTLWYLDFLNFSGNNMSAKSTLKRIWRKNKVCLCEREGYGWKEATWLLVVKRRGWQLPMTFMESQKVQETEDRMWAPAKQNLMKKEKLPVRDFPSGPVVKIPCPLLQGAGAQLLREPRSHVPCGLAKNKQNWLWEPLQPAHDGRELRSNWANWVRDICDCYKWM